MQIIHTIFLTSHNRGYLIKEAIKSISSLYKFQCLILDNGSNKETLEIIKTAIKNKKQFSLIEFPEKKCLAPYAAMIEESKHLAQGEWIHYLCDDDLFGKKRLNFNYGKGDAYYFRLIYFGDENKINQSFRFPGNIFNIGSQILYNLDHNQVTHRRGFLEKCIWNKDAQWADGEFFNQIAKFTEIHPINIIGVYKRMHKNSITYKYLTK